MAHPSQGMWSGPSSPFEPGPSIPSPRLPVARPADLLPAAHWPASARHGAPVLNVRDVALLQHLAEGRSVAQIAAAMAVTTNTTRTRIRRIQVKLSVVGRTGMVREARALGAL